MARSCRAATLSASARSPSATSSTRCESGLFKQMIDVRQAADARLPPCLRARANSSSASSVRGHGPDRCILRAGARAVRPARRLLSRWSSMPSAISIRAKRPPISTSSTAPCRRGFKTKTVVAALDALAAAAPRPADRPHSRFRFRRQTQADSGSRQTLPTARQRAETIARAKDPATFFAAARQTGHSASRDAADATRWSGDGWLTKRTGGSGGRHIRVCRPHVRRDARRYFQKQLDGRAGCRSAASSRDRRAGFALDAANGSRRSPRALTASAARCRARSRSIPTPKSRRTMPSQVGTALGLVGHGSFDFIVANGAAAICSRSIRDPAPPSTCSTTRSGTIVPGPHCRLSRRADARPLRHRASRGRARAIASSTPTEAR